MSPGEFAYDAWRRAGQSDDEPFFSLSPAERERWEGAAAAVQAMDDRIAKAVSDAIHETMPDAFEVAEAARLAVQGIE